MSLTYKGKHSKTHLRPRNLVDMDVGIIIPAFAGSTTIRPLTCYLRTGRTRVVVDTINRLTLSTLHHCRNSLDGVSNTAKLTLETCAHCRPCFSPRLTHIQVAFLHLREDLRIVLYRLTAKLG